MNRIRGERPVQPFRRFRKTFFRYFLRIIAISIAILLLASVLFYGSFERLFTAQIHSQAVDFLYQIRTVFSSLHFWMVPAFMQLASESPVADIMHRSGLPLLDRVRSIDRLINAVSTYQFLHSLYIRNGRTGGYFSSVGGDEGTDPTDRTLPVLLSDLKRFGTFRYIPRKILIDKRYTTPGSGYGPSPYNVLTMVVGTPPGDGSAIGSALIINISEEKLRNSYLRSNPFSDSMLIILDRNGTVLSHPDPDAFFGADLSNEAYVRRILTEEKPAGSFTMKDDSREFLVTYVTYSELGWHFLLLTPADAVLSRLRAMRNAGIFSFILIFIICIVLSLLISSRLSAPIRRLFSYALNAGSDLEVMPSETEPADEIRYIDEAFKNIVKKTGILNEQVRRQEELQRTGRLREFLSGTIDGPEFEQTIATLPGNMFASPAVWYVLVARIDRYREVSETSSFSDFRILRENLAGTLSAVIGLPAVAVDMGGDHVALITGDASGGNEGDFENGLAERAGGLFGETGKAPGYSVTIGIGRGVKTADRLHEAYDTAFEATQYRFVAGYGRCIVRSRIPAPAGGYRFPEDTVRKLLAELRLGSPTRARALLSSMFDHVGTHSYGDFRFMLKMIAWYLEKLMDHPENTPSRTYGDMKRKLAEATDAETILEAEERLARILDSYAAAQEPSQLAKRKELVEQIRRMIGENFADPGFCVETIATRLKLSTNYLRSFYKINAGTSLSAFLHEFRLAEAAGLLLGTDLTVGEIARRAGFSNYNYFFTSFKKATGQTPLIYRQNPPGAEKIGVTVKNTSAESSQI